MELWSCTSPAIHCYSLSETRMKLGGNLTCTKYSYILSDLVLRYSVYAQLICRAACTLETEKLQSFMPHLAVWTHSTIHSALPLQHAGKESAPSVHRMVGLYSYPFFPITSLNTAWFTPANHYLLLLYTVFQNNSLVSPVTRSGLKHLFFSFCACVCFVTLYWIRPTAFSGIQKASTSIIKQTVSDVSSGLGWFSITKQSFWFQAHSVSIILHHSTAYYMRVFPKWPLHSVISTKTINCFMALRWIKEFGYGHFIALWIRPKTTSETDPASKACNSATWRVFYCI